MVVKTAPTILMHPLKVSKFGVCASDKEKPPAVASGQKWSKPEQAWPKEPAPRAGEAAQTFA